MFSKEIRWLVEVVLKTLVDSNSLAAMPSNSLAIDVLMKWELYKPELCRTAAEGLSTSVSISSPTVVDD